MSQSDFGNLESPLSGTALINSHLEPWRDALHSCHAGSSRPTYAVASMLWINDSVNPWVVNVFDGSQDIPIGTINITTNLFSVNSDLDSISGISTFIKTLLDDTDAATARATLGASSKAETVTAVKTSAYTVTTADDFVPCDATSAGFTVTLYTAVGNSGRPIKIKKTDNTLNQITIDADSSELIDSDLTKKLSTQYETIVLESDGTKWHVVNRFGIVTPWVPYAASFTGFGTPSGVSMWSRRNGDSLEIRGYFTSGSATAVAAGMSMGYGGLNQPTGLTSDSTKVSAFSLAGPVVISAVGIGFIALVSGGSNVINFAAQNSSNQGLTVLNGNAFASSGNRISLLASVPITGWES